MSKKGTIYVGKEEYLDIRFTRVWSMPNAWTFSIKPVAELLGRYVKHPKKWADPFAGRFSPAYITNDHNPTLPAMYHMEAIDFAKMLNGPFEGILFDPPYSFRQISEHYKHLGMKAKQWQTSMSFYEKVKTELCNKVQPGGFVICCGWNTNGFGKARGFRLVEIMAVAHGGSKNDTLVTVEVKTPVDNSGYA